MSGQPIIGQPLNLPQMPVGSALIKNSAVNGAATVGSDPGFARADHTHEIPSRRRPLPQLWHGFEAGKSELWIGDHMLEGVSRAVFTDAQTVQIQAPVREGADPVWEAFEMHRRFVLVLYTKDSKSEDRQSAVVYRIDYETVYPIPFLDIDAYSSDTFVAEGVVLRGARLGSRTMLSDVVWSQIAEAICSAFE